MAEEGRGLVLVFLESAVENVLMATRANNHILVTAERLVDAGIEVVEMHDLAIFLFARGHRLSPYLIATLKR